MDEQQLIEQELRKCLCACATGDRGAFETLYKHTYPKFNAIILNMVRDQDLTNDILQLAYMSIWKSSGRYDQEKGKAFTWMLVIMRNRAIDVIRSNRRLSSAEHLSETLEDETAKTDKKAMAFLFRRKLEPHLSILPKDMRTAIILNVVHGLTSREIGEHMNVPTNTAKSWVRRGLKKMRKKMGSDRLEEIL